METENQDLGILGSVHDYNTVRPHSSLNYMMPNEFETRIVGDKALKEEWIEKQKDILEGLKSVTCT